MRKKIPLIMAVFLLAVVGTWNLAQAYSVPLAFKFKFENKEMINLEQINWDPLLGATQTFNIANTVEDNWGIVRVTSIIDRETADIVWSSGDNSEYLTGIFWGLATQKVTAIDIDGDMSAPELLFGEMTTATVGMGGLTMPNLDGLGGVDAGLSFYLSSTDVWMDAIDGSDGDGGPTGRVGAANIFSPITDGVKQADFMFKDGITSTVGVIATNKADTGLLFPPTGEGKGFLEVVDNSGPLSDLVVRDVFTNFTPPQATNIPGRMREIFLEFDFRPHPDAGMTDYGWDVNSEDPAIGHAIPEPGTMLLLGSGLIGLTGLGRRKFRKKLR